jgi:hypothetical protein
MQEGEERDLKYGTLKMIDGKVVYVGEKITAEMTWKSMVALLKKMMVIAMIQKR